jgi:hypothetical protein
MHRTLILGLFVALLLSCSEDTAGKADGPPADGNGGMDITPGKDLVQDQAPASDTSGVDLPRSDLAARDLPPGDIYQPSRCSPAKDTCTGGQKCECCGSIGPMAICICSRKCAKDSDCTNKLQPSCNKPTPTSASGICTPKGFNCCWFCK